MPAASVSANLEQLHLLPDGVRVYLTCGNDDAQAFAGRLPAELERGSALFLDAKDAPLLTATDSPDAAIAALGAAISTVVITRGAQPAIAILDGERLDSEGFDVGPAVDPTGDRDLMAAAYAWADLAGADARSAVSWAQLYSELAMTVPTATGGAVTEARLLEEGLRRGLEPPPRAQPR